MNITVVSLFPEVFGEFIGASIIGRAITERLVSVKLVDLRTYSRDKHRKCDDYPYGGGPGMVMKAEPVIHALEEIGVEGKRVVYPSASGTPYNQREALRLSREGEIVIVCGHYEGMDQRIIDRYVTDEIAVGDYVLSGGESAAMVIIDSVVRLLDGVINPSSLESESFSGGLLEYPQYTRPRTILGMTVPEVLLNGNHEEIRRWRLRKSVEKTRANRPDLLAHGVNDEEVVQIIRESEVQEHGSDQGGGSAANEGTDRFQHR
ncbi:MAG: tRNA (guanosine(37)-N1)-methyltransferase TrmD [Spirochaetales bacterium]|nr:tRNA (guanosine(37)-N1)-methyltransferase TrmD [Spirochaetales bacterium]